MLRLYFTGAATNYYFYDRFVSDYFTIKQIKKNRLMVARELLVVYTVHYGNCTCTAGVKWLFSSGVSKN